MHWSRNFFKENGEGVASDKGSLLIFMAVAVFIFFCFSGILYSEVRIKDIARISDTGSTEIFGYGLVVGLNGTGDGNRSLFTVQSIANMLENMGIAVPASGIRTRNVAAVIVTTQLPGISSAGAKLDCTVSSLGDAKSLQGGILLHTPLYGIDGKIYGAAQGALSMGGFNYDTGDGGSIQKNHATVGRIPDGVSVKNVPSNEKGADNFLRLILHYPDYSSASRMAGAINTKFNKNLANALDNSMVMVEIPSEYREGGRSVDFIAELEVLTLEVDRPARVIINERTGTVVAGEYVQISPVAISHGNLTVEIKKTKFVSQPGAFSEGTTVVETQTDANVKDESVQVLSLPELTNVGEIAQALNMLGVSPRDLIAIFQALKEAGALQAELIIM